MDRSFFEYIFDKQLKLEAVPSNNVMAQWATRLISLLFPEYSTNSFSSVSLMEEEFGKLEKELTALLDATKACRHCNNHLVAKTFFNGIPELYRVLNTDIQCMLQGDPAARSEFEIIRAYPGFYAISFYRLAHALLKLDVPLLPRILTEHAHSHTGIDIHPGAEIGEYLYIDHGTGTVIGETSIIGNHVKLYQGVTLGALSVDKSMAFTKRHPSVEDHVVIYSGATILGGDTVIGHHSTIGGNVWITKSIPAYSTVYHQSVMRVENNQSKEQSKKLWQV